MRFTESLFPVLSRMKASILFSLNDEIVLLERSMTSFKTTVLYIPSITD